MREKVREGYEKGDYEGDYREGREIQEKEEEFLQRVFERITDNGKVLDLGCGTGIPFDQYIVDNGYQLTGIDIAEKHIEKAEENIPEANFIQGGFFDQDFERGSFDAIVSFYAIFHIPRDEHQELFERINYWLEEDGIVLVTMGAEEMSQNQGDIGGEEMLWSSYSPEKNKDIIRDAGFDIIDSYTEDWREETHLWVMAEKE